MFFARLLSQKPGQASISPNELAQEGNTYRDECPMLSVSGCQLENLSLVTDRLVPGKQHWLVHIHNGNLESLARVCSATNLLHDLCKSVLFSELQFLHL